FVVGDFIETANFSGVVVEVGVRSSRIRALDGAQITVPNGKLVDMIITNHGVRTYRRYATSLGVTYDTNPDVLEKFVEGVKKVASEHPLVRTDSVTVQFHEMANSSLNIFFAAIYETSDHGEWLKARQEVFLAVMRLAEERGVSFAFPSTSVYIESMPEGTDIVKE
ncbi:MAG: mechanosensitive ion channel domain-containing protein, partial [Bacteroidota bacterium]